MPARTKSRSAAEILAWLERRGSRRNVEGMARYGIVAERVFGVSVGTLRGLAKKLGRDHELATALWKSGWYEARMLAAFVEEPERVTRAQMDAWAGAFDNWAICDTVCFHLFDRLPFAWSMAKKWAAAPGEFKKRAAFALAASIALHDKQAPDAPFLAFLPYIERAASDERNFVKKAVSWALRGIGRRNVALNAKSIALAKRLAASSDATRRWVGRDALRELESRKIRALLQRRAAPGRKATRGNRTD